MNLCDCITRHALRKAARTLCACLLAWGAGVAAAPGAHGPNGEHLDAAPQSGPAAARAPGFEARSELFELVARLEAGELSLLIDRFETNEPVLDASVEVESGGLKAVARFHADLGDYAVDDGPLLQRLATPGEHAVLVTVLSGPDSDLLDGMLRVGAQAATVAHGSGHGGRAWLVALAVLAVLAIWAVLALAGLLRRGRHRHRRGAALAGIADGGQA